ncbi:MAG: amidohydrolase family protein [Parerythrobacter sp.]
MIRASLFTAALLCSASPALADTLIDNVQGIAFDENGEIDRFTALLVDDAGRVQQVLRDGDRRPADPDFMFDGKGQVVLPGLMDSHLHMMDLGFGALTLDLSDTTSLAEAQAKIAAYAEEYPGRPWIIGRGWNQVKWGLGRFPTAAELDVAVEDRPVWLERSDNHAGWGNTAALKAAGITAATQSPPGGRIERMAGSNEPSGVFVDEAYGLVQKIVPAPTPADRDLALVKAQDTLVAMGVTAAADMGTTIEDWQALRRAGDAGALRVRTISYAAGVDAMQLIGGPGPTRWLYGDRLRLNGVKLYLDGALGSRGAWLKRPYADDAGNTGLPLQTPTQLRNLMSRAALDDFQLAIHAIGDAANGEVLAAIGELAQTYDGDRRWRIEHAQIVDTADIAKFGAHGVIASMQPVHQTSDRTMAEQRLDAPRLEGAYAWRTIMETGAPLAFGSDAPVERPDPFAGLAAAISRTDADGQPFGGWRPGETVNRTVALRGYTADGAHAAFADGKFGKLMPGEWADFIIVDRDPLIASPADIRKTRVLQTWVAGQQVYIAPE